ncbi:MAG: DUF2555 domain-containing protein [Cyanobium sp.]
MELSEQFKALTDSPAAGAGAITAELIASFDEESTADLARRLDEDDYPTPFDGLQDWHLMRSLAIHRPELARPYVHLVDQEPFDEE